MTQALDFAAIVGKTLKHAYISASFHSIILLFSDFTWFEMAHPVGIDEDVRYTGLVGHQYLIDATVVSVDVVDAYGANITTNLGTAVFNAVIVQPNYISSSIDIHPIADVQSYDDNHAVRMVGMPEGIKEIRYAVIDFDIQV